MAIYFCMNCYHQFVGQNYYEYPLTCPHCLTETFPMFYSCVVPLNNNMGSKDVQMQSYNQLLCYPTGDRQMMNWPIPVPYGSPYEQMGPHVEHNGPLLPPPPQLTAPSYSNSSNGSIVHSLNSVEDSEAQSLSSIVNDLSLNEIPGNNSAAECLKNLASLLKGNVYISDHMRRKLGNLMKCHLNDEKNQDLALIFCFSLGERVIFELMGDNRMFQDSISNLLASIRSKGCQFLGLPMQDEILKLILLALESGKDLTRKELVTFVLERLQHHRLTSKKKIGDVVQLLYRACCFNITKREKESALMQLKENLRDYNTLREQHDAQVVQIATEAKIRISSDDWALLLYNNVSKTSYMKSIIDKLNSSPKFEELVKEFEIFAQGRSNDVHLKRFCVHLKNLAEIGYFVGPVEVKITKALDEIYQIVREILQFNKQQYKKPQRARNAFTEEQHHRNQSTKSYKLRLGRNVALYRNFPRGNNCNFVHSRAEYNCNRNIS